MNILVGPSRNDLPLADRIFRLAFGTFNGLPDPLQHGGDSLSDPHPLAGRPRRRLQRRWGKRPGGFNLVTHWGSVGYFGP